MSKVDINHFFEDPGGFLLCKWCKKDIEWVQDVSHDADCIVSQLATVSAERDALAAVFVDRSKRRPCDLCKHRDSNIDDEPCHGCDIGASNVNFEPIVPADTLAAHDRELLERYLTWRCVMQGAESTRAELAMVDEFLRQEGK